MSRQDPLVATGWEELDLAALARENIGKEPDSVLFQKLPPLALRIIVDRCWPSGLGVCPEMDEIYWEITPPKTLACDIRRELAYRLRFGECRRFASRTEGQLEAALKVVTKSPERYAECKDALDTPHAIREEKLWALWKDLETGLRIRGRNLNRWQMAKIRSKLVDCAGSSESFVDRTYSFVIKCYNVLTARYREKGREPPSMPEWEKEWWYELAWRHIEAHRNGNVIV